MLIEAHRKELEVYFGADFRISPTDFKGSKTTVHPTCAVPWSSVLEALRILSRHGRMEAIRMCVGRSLDVNETTRGLVQNQSSLEFWRDGQTVSVQE